VERQESEAKNKLKRMSLKSREKEVRLLHIHPTGCMSGMVKPTLEGGSLLREDA
jgi:hypothetical protein